MSGTIKFYYPNETFVYHIKKCFGKLIYLKKQHYLVLEIESTDELHHVDEDSIQSEFPEIRLGVDDFPVDVEFIEELQGQTISIPNGIVETQSEEDEDEIIEVIYTWLEIIDEVDLETNDNIITFSQDKPKKFKWKGFVSDWTNTTDQPIKFVVNAQFTEFNDEDSVYSDDEL